MDNIDWRTSMTRSRFVSSWLALLAGCAVCIAALAQGEAPAPVLKGSQVTESALIDALSIGNAQPGAEGRTRGFRPANGPAATSGKPAKAGPGKASLLITFATDSAQLTPGASQALDVVAKALESDQLAGLSFTVEGHADPRGSEAHNLALSKARADSVIDYLVTHHGVLRERLDAVGKGSSELMDPAHPDAPENRRVTIVTRRD
jgi:outer membrane protein OmpA-like peptidoglycan-associated protein